MPEMKIERVMGGDAVESVKFHHLIQRHELLDVRQYIEIEIAKIDVGSLADSVEEGG